MTTPSRRAWLAAGVVGLTVGLLTALMAAALPATSSAAVRPSRGHTHSDLVQPTLVARAALSADYLAPGPPSGALATPGNGRSGPFAGQVIPGFSAMIENGDGTFWAQPDNGFGTKANSADFLLRLYLVRPHWETARGGPGRIQVKRFISLRDPEHQIPFAIVNAQTSERMLTGADFDIESLVRAPDGTFWIGEEFGPFLLHVNQSGKVLEQPVQFPYGKSPQNPYLTPGETPRIAASRGFEAMAASASGRYLYPILEGAFVDDTDQRRRVVYEYDVRARRYTGRTWQYQVDEPGNFAADAFTVRDGRLLVLERDNYDGAAAVTKRIYQVDLRDLDADGFATKSLVVDLLTIANPDDIGTATSPGAYGLGDPFAFPMVSVETAVQLRDGRLLVANDNNYPGDDARVPGTPDDTEMILIDLDRVRRPSPHQALVIGHRGSAGTRPEHTLASYEQAILACADYIEPDLVSTKDGVLVARHEPEIGGTTDVASHPEFASLRTTKVLDGVAVTGWFTEDFTFAQLRTLRAVERLPAATRPVNHTFDGLYRIPTFDEVLDLARHSRTCDGGPVGVYPETKHPTYFDDLGLSLEEPLLATLTANDFEAGSPVFIQSFETGNLRELDHETDFPLVQLVDCAGAPYDLKISGDPRTYADLVTAQGLQEVATYADGIGPCKNLVVPRAPDGSLLEPSDVVGDAHASGLVVHPFTFRVENQFLPLEFRSSPDPNAPGDLAGELRAFLEAGVDGFFTDNPVIGATVVG